ncbi:MAG: cytochrome B [Balneolaceae bacterium]|nr:cytochrome B [Balneolaceae bacterium]
MYNGLLHAHSGLRWIVLILLLLAVIKALSGWFADKDYSKGDKMLSLFTMIFTHIQFLIGLGLYFMSPKVVFSGDTMGNTIHRFFTVEHMLMMLIAIALITIGYGKAKRATETIQKHKKTTIYYGIALLIILAAIPWPFRALGAGWF